MIHLTAKQADRELPYRRLYRLTANTVPRTLSVAWR